MFKAVTEVVLAIIVLFAPSGYAPVETAAAVDIAPVSAEPMVVSLESDEEIYSHQSEGAMLARFENILNNNYCFASDFDSAEKMVAAATISLAAHIEDGYISAANVDNFILNMYGKDIEGEVLSEREGYYAVLPRGYDIYSHKVIEYSYVGDGSIEVYSEVTVNPDTDAEIRNCKSVLFADGMSAFGYILLSCEIY